MKTIVLFLKSHVDQYQKRDGTVVGPHEISAVAHPKGHKPGSPVFFPHPDPKKKGKSALGKYLGQRNGKSVVKHEQGEGKEHDVEHDDVKPARGIPKSADPDSGSATHHEFKDWAKNVKSD